MTSNTRRLLLLIFMLPGLCRAELSPDFFRDFQVHGFLSQGYIYTTDNNFFGHSSEGAGSVAFTEIGLNVSGRIKPSIFASAQVLSRRAGEFYTAAPILDYGLLDFTLANKADWMGGVRIGRIKNSYGFYNDSRDVAVTRPGIFLPQSIYFDKVRNLVLHSDGLQVYADFQLENSDFYFQSSYGRPEIDRNVEYAFLIKDFPGTTEQEDPMSMTRLLYEWNGGTLRLGYTKTIGNFAYRPAATPPADLLAGVVDIDIDVLSFELNDDRWSLTSEYWQENVTTEGFGALFSGVDQTATGWYVQGTYRHRSDLEFFLRYDESRLNEDDPKGIKTASSPLGLALGIPAYRNYAIDWTAGMRWDLTKDLMLRAEYHSVEGTAWLSSRETPFSEMVRNWEMFNLLLSYHF